MAKAKITTDGAPVAVRSGPGRGTLAGGAPV